MSHAAHRESNVDHMAILNRFAFGCALRSVVASGKFMAAIRRRPPSAGSVRPCRESWRCVPPRSRDQASTVSEGRATLFAMRQGATTSESSKTMTLEEWAALGGEDADLPARAVVTRVIAALRTGTHACGLYARAGICLM